MLRNIEEVGAGRLWAVDAAQRVAGLSLEQGLEACATHIAVATEARIGGIYESSSPTHIRTCAKFVTQTEAIIDAWEESEGQVLPMEHFDFGYNLTTRDARIHKARNPITP